MKAIIVSTRMADAYNYSLYNARALHVLILLYVQSPFL